MASWLVMALFLFMVPLLVIWPIGLTHSPYDEKRLLVVTLLALIAVLFVAVRPLRLSWLSQLATLPRAVVLTSSAVLLLGVISATQARLPVAALTEPALWVVLFSAMTAVAALRSRLGSHFDTAMTGMVAFILFVYLMMVCGYVAQIVIGMRDPDFRTLFVNFSHLRFFNDFQSWTLPLAMLPILYAEQRGWTLLKWLFAVAAANWWLLLFLTGGRGVFLAVITSALFVALLFKGRIAHWLKWYGLAAAGGVVLYLMITQLAPAVVTLSRSSLSGREELWRLALSMVAEHPLLGVGPMHYACVDPALAGHPHNAVLQIAAEWGLPAALLLSGLLLWLFYRAIVQTRRSSPVSGTADVAPILLASLFSATVLAQFAGMIVMPINHITIVVMGGWLWGLLVLAHAEQSPWRLPHTVWLLITAASIALLMNVISPVWRDAISGTMTIADPSYVYKPRFWTDGEICRDDSLWRH
jgi:O-antigen ligase